MGCGELDGSVRRAERCGCLNHLGNTGQDRGYPTAIWPIARKLISGLYDELDNLVLVRYGICFQGGDSCPQFVQRRREPPDLFAPEALQHRRGGVRPCLNGADGSVTSSSQRTDRYRSRSDNANRARGFFQKPWLCTPSDAYEHLRSEKNRSNNYSRWTRRLFKETPHDAISTYHGPAAARLTKLKTSVGSNAHDNGISAGGRLRPISLRSKDPPATARTCTEPVWIGFRLVWNHQR